jgi:GNAT superfamily N-acetyltransferase
VSDAVRIEAAERLELADCRPLVLASEPWITLGYGDAEAESIARSSSADNLLVARAGNHLVGFALSTPGILLGEYLKLLAVDADRRSAGIGRLLMEELERARLRAGRTSISASPTSIPARARSTAALVTRKSARCATCSSPAKPRS